MSRKHKATFSYKSGFNEWLGGDCARSDADTRSVYSSEFGTSGFRVANSNSVVTRIPALCPIVRRFVLHISNPRNRLDALQT